MYLASALSCSPPPQPSEIRGEKEGVWPRPGTQEAGAAEERPQAAAGEGGGPGGAPLVSPSVPRIQGCPGHPDLQRSCPLTSTLKSLSVTRRTRVPTSGRSQAEGLARLRTREVARGGRSTYPCARQVQGSRVQREIPRET